MIKLVVARGPNDKFEDYLEPSLKNFPDIDWVQVENGENDSIFKKYNRGVNHLKPEDNDIVVFCHADVKILDSNFCKKLQLIFDKKKDIGVLGLIGTVEFPLAGGWWIGDHSLHRGHLIQGMPGSDGKKTYHMVRKIGYFDDLISVDGFCFCVRGSVVKQNPFDEITYPNAYHFYDIDYCISVLEMGYKIAVADILMEHSSEGPMPESWYTNKIRFIEKMTGKGYSFPLTNSQFYKYFHGNINRAT